MTRMTQRQSVKTSLLFIFALCACSLIAAAAWLTLRPRAPVIAPHEEADEPRTASVSTAPIAPVKLGPPGQLQVSAAVPPDCSAVAYAVVSSSGVVLARGTLPVANGESAPQLIAIPSGGGTVTFVGTKTKDGASRTVYLGALPVEVSPGQQSAVQLSVGSEAEAATSRTPAAGSVAGTTVSGSTDSAVACRACEMSSAQGICDSPNITATSSTDPQTGEQTGIGWGCGTLPDAKAQAACLALLRCLNAKSCGRPGENPVLGCYCGDAPAEACMGGQGISGACIAEYQAAATSSPGGPAAGAAVGQLSRFVATAAGDPTTPVGLANNIKHCAMETHCEACEAL